MQILPGVYLINGSPYGRHQNGYLIRRDGATILIDSGDLEDAETLPEVERNAAGWGCDAWPHRVIRTGSSSTRSPSTGSGSGSPATCWRRCTPTAGSRCPGR